MNRRNLLFIVGVLIILTAVITGGLFGFNYEFKLQSTSDQPPTRGEYANFDQFDANDQQMIRGAINGKRYTFTNANNLPAAPGTAKVGKITTEYKKIYYTFKRGSFFDVSSLGGEIATILGVFGVAIVGRTVYREMRS